MNLTNRLTKLEVKLALRSQDQLMILVSKEETIKERLDRFNKECGQSLTDALVKEWRKLPFGEKGFYLLSPSWNFEDYLIMMHERKNQKVNVS